MSMLSPCLPYEDDDLSLDPVKSFNRTHSGKTTAKDLTPTGKSRFTAE